MSAAEILAEARARGIVLMPNGALLRVGAPEGALPAALHVKILAHKPELLELLRSEHEGEATDYAAAERAWRVEYAGHMARAYGYPDVLMRAALDALARQPSGRRFRVGKERITIEMGDGLEIRVHRTVQPWSGEAARGTGDGAEG